MSDSPKTSEWTARAEALSLQVLNYVDGKWRESSGERIEKKSPRDGRLLATFGAGADSDVQQAVASARCAFDDGRWSALPVQRRKEVLAKLALLLEKKREEFALLESLDAGKPISDALNVDVPMAARMLRYAAEAADKLHSKVYSADSSSLSYQLRRPAGVTAAIIGWNFPLVLAAQKIGPALATGNSLVLKPSEFTSFSAGKIAELALEAGVPPGVFNVVHGGPLIGTALAHHGGIDLLTFTGSTRTGKRLLVAAGESNMKRLILECGGKAPNIVFQDCPSLSAVADAVLVRAFWNQGEVCSASSRVLVQESIHDEFVRILVQKAAAWVLGDPLRPETTFGPLIHSAHKNKVLSYIKRGEEEGARMAHQSRGDPPFAQGYYVPVTIFDRVAPEHQIAQEEIFGPVLSVISFKDEPEAIRIANSTIYGLSAIAWTQDFARANRLVQGIRAGSVVINATANPTGGPGEGILSIGGHKESGIGVEGGLEGLEAYTSQTAVQFFT